MSFAEHLVADNDGEYDLAAAEAAHAEELRSDPQLIDGIILRAAKQDRRSWESSNRTSLAKNLSEPPLSPELALDQLVPLGQDRAVEYGQMDGDRIQRRKDLRTKKHLDENEAYSSEMRHWHGTEAQLDPGQTISDAIHNGGQP